jgi:hypothetical protein
VRAMAGAKVPISAALLIVSLGMAAAQDQALPPLERPGREISLPSTEVKDTFFAYVLGIIVAGVEVDVNNAQMREILTEFKSSLSLPFDLIDRVTQHAEAGEKAIGLAFLRDVSIPIPFSLLFYHPGSITATRDLLFQVSRSTMSDPADAGIMVPVFDLALESGTVLVDIDNWLEALLSAYLEDTLVKHIVFFKTKGDWIGMLEGTGRRTGKVLRAYFNFTRNAIVFPTPAALDRAGRFLVPDP